MKAFVVDVNVAIVANGRSPQADPACVNACLQALTEIHAEGIVVLDAGMRILRECMSHLSLSGQPGLGDFFMRWVWENQAVDARCERVTLRARNGDGNDFEEFPAVPALAGFDSSDRKYVATALASRLAPEILNAVDTDWWKFRDVLREHGVQVRCLCPQCMTELGEE